MGLGTINLDLNPVHDANLRSNFEKIRDWARSVEQRLGLVVAQTGPAGPAGPTGPAAIAGPLTPLSLPYPFVITAGTDLYQASGGIALLPSTAGVAQACRIRWAEMLCDPTAPATTAPTTFTLQNAATAPTAIGTITFATGATRAVATMNVLFATGQRLHIIAPAALNGLQDLYVIRLLVEGA